MHSCRAPLDPLLLRVLWEAPIGQLVVYFSLPLASFITALPRPCTSAASRAAPYSSMPS